MKTLKSQKNTKDYQKQIDKLFDRQRTHSLQINKLVNLLIEIKKRVKELDKQGLDQVKP